MTIAITPEADENLWRFWANKAQALADENKALSAALTASKSETAAAYEAALDADSGYMQRVYGDEWTFLSNPVDRDRILAAIPKGKEHE